MQKIIPHLWYDKEALEAATWYVSLFENSRIVSVSTIADTPSGDAQIVEFELAGLLFSSISAGPFFTLNPAISLMVACDTKAEVQTLYEQLKEGATLLMPLDEYPFSKAYVWLQDKYGLNWQLMFTEQAKAVTKIRPVLLFAGAVCGKAQQAIDYYATVFPETKVKLVNYYEEGEAEDNRAKINYAEIEIYGTEFIAMDHGSWSRWRVWL